MPEAIRWALVLSALAHVPVQAWRATRTGRWGARHAGWLRVAHPAGSPSLTGCYLAVVLPLAPIWLWPVFALGWWWSGSWLALGALSAASICGTTAPIGWLPLAILAALSVALGVSRRLGGRWRWGEWLPRGDSLDPLVQRLRTWRVVARALPRVLPWGRRPLGRDLRQYYVATGTPVSLDHAFNEYLEVAYEYGLPGLLGILGWAAVVGWHLHRGDPWSAAAVAWAVTLAGSITLRTWPFPLVGALLTWGLLER
jgi:hypothetical protein